MLTFFLIESFVENFTEYHFITNILRINNNNYNNKTSKSALKKVVQQYNNRYYTECFRSGNINRQEVYRLYKEKYIKKEIFFRLKFRFQENSKKIRHPLPDCTIRMDGCHSTLMDGLYS